MKIFIPTKDRPKTISTHLAFSGQDWYILVHNKQQRDEYLENETIDPSRLIVTGVAADAFGLTRQREWVVQNLVKSGEWFIFADDNIKELTKVSGDYYRQGELDVQVGESKKWKDIFSALCSPDEFMILANESRWMAEKFGAHLCGFAVTENFFFRGKKWRSVGYVIGKLMVFHNVGVPFDHTVTMEDFRNTAENLLRFGSVCINNFVWPRAGHYEAGGLGTYKERVPYRVKDCEILMQRYPGLFRYKERGKFVQHTDLALRLTTAQQVQAWRRKMTSGLA